MGGDGSEGMCIEGAEVEGEWRSTHMHTHAHLHTHT